MARIAFALGAAVLACAVLFPPAQAADGPGTLDQAVARLNDWDTSPNDRTAAIQTLRGAGPAALTHVHALLKSKLWTTRQDAASLAVQLNAPDISRILAELLGDPNWSVRAYAAQLAANLSPAERPKLEPAVRRLLDDPVARVRLAACDALAAWNPEGDHVSKALADSDPDVAYWAAQRFMKRVQGGKVTGEVRDKLIDSIIAKFQSNGWRSIDNMGIATLLSLGPGALDVLYEAINSEPQELRRVAVANIGSMAGKAGVELMFRMLTDPDSSVRGTAMNYVSNYCEPAHASRLLALLETSADADTRQYILRALGRIKHQKAVPMLLKLTEHQEYGIRQAALEALAQIGEKSVAPKLIQLYQGERHGWRRGQMISPIAQLLGLDALEFLREAARDDDSNVRMQATYAARLWLREADKTEFLFKVIKEEEDDNVRQNAISQLTDTQAAAGVDALIAALREGGPASRRAAAYALGRAKSVHAAKALVDLFDAEEDPNVREAVIQSLGQVRNRLAVPVFKQALQSTDARLRAAALNALSAFPEVLSDEFIINLAKTEEDEQVLRVWVNLVSSRNLADARLLPRLEKLMESADGSVHYAVVGCLGRIDGAQAFGLLCKVVKDSGHAEARRTAAASVVERLTARKVAPKAVTRALEDALQSPDPAAREQIVTALARLADRELGPLLLKTLRSDTADAVRRAAADGLRRVADKSMIPQLLEAAKGEDKTETMLVLIGLLGDLGDRAALPFFRDCLRSSEPSVQAAALRAIGSFRDSSLVPFYLERLKVTTSAEVRLTLLRNLSGWGDRRAVEAFRRSLKDEDPRVRAAALEAIVEFQDPEVVALLAERLAGPSEPDGAADHVIDLLAAARLSSVAAQLISLAAKTDDAAVLGRLYVALGRTGDRRAIPLLAEAVKKGASDELTAAAVEALVALDAREQAALCLALARNSIGRLSYIAAAAAARLDPVPDAVKLITERLSDGTLAEKLFHAGWLARVNPPWAERLLRDEIQTARNELVLAGFCAALAARPGENAEVLRRVALADLGAPATTAALRALGRTADPANETVFRRVLASSRSADVRAAALEQLVRSHASAADVPEIVLRSIASAEPEVRLAALRAAATLTRADPALVQALLPLAKQTENAAVRADAVKALGAMRGSAEAEAALIDLATKADESAPLAEAAAALGALRSAAAVPRLTELAASGPLAVRVASVEALGRIGTEPALKAVAESFDQPDADGVRAAAARALGSAGRVERVGKLADALRSAPALDVRAACAEALGMLGGDGARAALIGALKQDSGVVRASAARALGAVRGPEVEAELKKMLADTDVQVVAAVREAIGRLSDRK